MTVIAWDGETLAGDRQSTHEGTPCRTRKVFRVQRGDDGKEVLVGCAGDTGDCQLYVRWVQGKTKEKPNFRNLIVMTIDAKRRIWCATEAMHWYKIGAGYWAIGSGANYALGAMGHGANAREAARIACDLDVHSGFGIDVVRFNGSGG